MWQKLFFTHIGEEPLEFLFIRKCVSECFEEWNNTKKRQNQIHLPQLTRKKTDHWAMMNDSFEENCGCAHVMFLFGRCNRYKAGRTTADRGNSIHAVSLGLRWHTAMKGKKFSRFSRLRPSLNNGRPEECYHDSPAVSCRSVDIVVVKSLRLPCRYFFFLCSQCAWLKLLVTINR